MQHHPFAPLWQGVRHLPSWSGVNPPLPFRSSSSPLPSGGRPDPPSGGVTDRVLGVGVFGVGSGVRVGCCAVGWFGGSVLWWGVGSGVGLGVGWLSG